MSTFTSPAHSASLANELFLLCAFTALVLQSCAPDSNVQLGACLKCINDLTTAAKWSWVKRLLPDSNWGCTSLSPPLFFFRITATVQTFGTESWHNVSGFNEETEAHKIKKEWKEIKTTKQVFPGKDKKSLFSSWQVTLWTHIWQQGSHELYRE